MQMSYREIQETCDDFQKFMEEYTECVTFAAIGDLDEVISLTIEEARKHGIIKSKDCCSGGPQWGHAWNCPKQIG